MADFTVIDNRRAVMAALQDAAEAGLEACGQQAESHAKQNVTKAGRIGATGALRNEISHMVDAAEKSVYIGTNTEYAIFNEIGTGIYLEGGGGRQTPWSYQDAKGQWHRTRGMTPIHFLKNAVANHVSEYKAILTQFLKRN